MAKPLAVEQPRRQPGASSGTFALWALGFRPFYLLAATFAALSVPLWLAQYAGLLPAPYVRGPAWHGHEMLFGYALAVIAGFLFTAGRNWTGQPTPTGNLLAASEKEGEPLWRMPIPDAYNKQIDSVIADVKNTGGRPGGSITAALFLQKFVNGLPWAHLDIASTAWKKPSTVPTIPDGATGYGVRLLNRMVQDKYEG